MKINLFLYMYIQHFNSILISSNFLPLKKCYCVHFLKGGVSEKVFVVCTRENVDIFGWPLS